MTSAPTAAVLIIGNEILSGRTPDANLNAIAKKLSSLGIKLYEARVVPDIQSEIVKAVNELRSLYTYLFTTGGIGPTHDDITAESIAKAFKVPLIEHPEARARLNTYYRESKINEARLRMARMPTGCSLIDNPISAAPGFQMENVFVLAGVPGIMQAMLDHSATLLRHGPSIHSIAVSASVGESVLASDLAVIASHYPELEIGSYPWFRQGLYGTALVVRGTNHADIQTAAEAIFHLVEKCGGKPEYETTPHSAA